MLNIVIYIEREKVGYVAAQTRIDPLARTSSGYELLCLHFAY